MSMSSVGHSSATKHALTAKVPSGESVRGSSVSTLLFRCWVNTTIFPVWFSVPSPTIYRIRCGQWFQSADIEDLHAALSNGEVALNDAQQDALYQFLIEKNRERVPINFSRCTPTEMPPSHESGMSSV